MLQKRSDVSSLCPSCYLNGGREAHPAGPSTSGVLIYRLEKSGDVNYLQPIVSCMHSQLARKADCFFTFNCVGILSGFFFFFKVDMEEAEAGRVGVSHLGDMTAMNH